MGMRNSTQNLFAWGSSWISPNYDMLLFKVTQCYNYLMNNGIFYQAKSFMFHNAEQPCEFLLVNSGKSLLHCITPNSNMH